MFDRRIPIALASIILICGESLANEGRDLENPPTDTQTAPPDRTESVTRLIEQLGAEDWTTREAASTSLIEMGPEITERLQAALAQADDPEVRSRLETAIAQINENDLIGPSIITLNFVDAPVTDVLDELNRQARCSIYLNVPDPANTRPVTVQIERATFWEAAEAIERATGLNFGVQQHIWTLGRQGRSFPNGINCESGPLQFVVTQYQLIANYADGDFGIGKSNLLVSVRGEPKVTLAQGKTRIIVDKVVDDRGNDLSARSDAGGIWLNERAFGNVNIPLARPRDIGTKILELSGHVELSLATRIESIRIENLADFQGFERSAGTMKIRIDPLTEIERGNLQPGALAIKVSVIDNVNREQIQQRLSSAINMARVVDSQGRPAGRPSPQYSAGDVPNEFSCIVSFQAGAADLNDVLSLRFDIPIDYRQLTTRFSFKDLPLP